MKEPLSQAVVVAAIVIASLYNILYNILTSDGAQKARDSWQQKVLKQLRVAKLDRSNLCDPNHVCWVPFVANLQIMGGQSCRFAPLSDGCFEFMGRTKVAELLDYAMAEPKNSNLLVYGTTGYGKSYILAAVAAFLFSERFNKRSELVVVYIPDCALFAQDAVRVLKYALDLAFFNDETKRASIKDLDSFQSLWDFCVETEQETTLLFIADQFNALSTTVLKSEVYTFLMYRPHAILGASANNECAKELFRKQLPLSYCYLIGGLDEAETKCWFNRHPFLRGQDEISLATGNLPLYLYKLRLECSLDPRDGNELAWEEETFARRRAWLCRETERIADDLYAHFSNQSQSGLDICIQTHTNLLANKNPGTSCFDHRYFYSTHKYTNIPGLHSASGASCGMVQKALVAALRRAKRLTNVASSNLYDLISECECNHAVFGYWVEQIVLATIQANGFKNLFTPKPPAPEALESTLFREVPKYLSVEVRKAVQFVPVAYDFPYIDSIYVWRPEFDTWHIYAVQVTISNPTSHASTYKIFQNMKPEWYPKAPHKQTASVYWHLVWITRAEYSKRYERKNCKVGDITLDEIFLSFRDMNAQLADILLEER